ncbi:MAG TPA: PQQ-binding-like beta-propeller repeat protein, partial [Candidatus Lokiarchaeia archaeon]|nr:PQQ-binding-like beta-propeller repeat protein [Candidatus Lokiarchaeia archaeon]
MKKQRGFNHARAVIIITSVLFTIILFMGMNIISRNSSGNGGGAISNERLPISTSGSETSDQAGDEWPMFHGALNHTGVAMTTPVQGLGPTWTYTTGGVVESSPAVVGGRVYVGCDDGKVYCLNAITGASVWNYTTGGAVISSPAVASGRVYVGSYDHKVYCLNAMTGASLWNYTTINYIQSSPAVAGGCVYIGSNNVYIYSLNATTGALIRTSQTGSASSPAIVNGLLYIGCYDYKIDCINTSTGTLLWRAPQQNIGFVQSSPAVVGDRVYFGDWNRVFCENATTGADLWGYQGDYMGNIVTSSPAVAGGYVYVGVNNGMVYCLNATTGAGVWTYLTGNAVTSSPAVGSGLVFVGSNDNKTYCLNATTGSLAWSYTTGGAVTSSPAVANGHVYVGSQDHKIYCFPMMIVPTAPLSLTLTARNMHVLLNWTAPASTGGAAIAYYRIYQGTFSGGETLLATIGNQLTYNASGLTNGQAYYFKVQAANGCGFGVNSTEASETPHITESSAPLSFTATAGKGFVYLTWASPATDGGSAIIGYDIYRGTTPGGEILMVTAISTLSYNNTGLASNITYYYKVRALNGVGQGPSSTEASVTTWTVPTAPQLFTATTGNSRVVLTWGPPASNGGTAIMGYKIYVGTTPGGETLNATLGVVLDYTITGLINGRVYYFKVSALNVMGEGNRSAATASAQWSALVWTYTTGNRVYSSPVVVGGHVFVGSDDDNVYCLDATTGNYIWSYATDGSIYFSPAVTGSRVYVGSDDDNVYCLDATTGHYIWSYATGGNVESSPLVMGGRLYVGSNDYKVYCLDAITGALIWNYTTGSYVESSPAIMNGRVYVGSDDYRLYCLNMTTGLQLWNYTAGSDFDWSSPIIAGGRVYSGCDDGNVYCLNATTGVKIWNYLTGSWIESTPFFVGGRVYIGCGDGNVYCLDATTGAQVWNYTTGSWIESSPFIVGGRVYIGCGDDNVYCLNVTNGMKILFYKTGNYIVSSPTVVGGQVYIGCGDDNVYCLSFNPAITQPLPTSYCAGTTGHAISWAISGPQNGTRSWTIYRDGTTVATGSWTSGTPVTVNVDGLAIGSYNYTIVASDGLGGTSNSTVIVTVIALPTITQPANVKYDAGTTGHSISWMITSASTGTRSFAIY